MVKSPGKEAIISLIADGSSVIGHRLPRTIPCLPVRNTAMLLGIMNGIQNAAIINCNFNAWLVGMKRTGSMDFRRASCDYAFTLVEVMVSLVVLVVVFSGFYLCLSEGFATAKVARESLRASELLQQQMETIRLYTWSQINSNGFIPPTFTVPMDTSSTASPNGPVYNGQITIANAPMSESYSNDHRLVTVTLTWGSGGTQRQRQMRTLVSQYGLHNYYY